MLPNKKWIAKTLGRTARIGVGVGFTVLAIAHTLGYVKSDVVTRLDHFFYDVRVNADLKKLKKDPRIVIVDIDEKSLAQVGRWPWPRDTIAKLVTSLTDEYQVSAIGFDVVFAEPEKTDANQALRLLIEQAPSLAKTIHQLAPSVVESLDRDQKLVKVLKDRPVVLGYYFNHEKTNQSGQLPKPLFSQAQLDGARLDGLTWDGYGANLASLQAVAEGGFFNPVVDSDGMVRSAPILSKFNDHYYQSFALAVYRMALNQPQLIPIFPENVDKNYGALDGFLLKSDEVETVFPVERNMVLLSRFRGKGGPNGGGFQYVSASDVLNQTVAPAQLAGRIILVGTTAPGLMDLRSTPVNPVFPGVEVHANIISSLLDGQFKLRPEYASGVVMILLLITGLLLSVLMAILSATASLIVAALVMVSSISVNIYTYSQYDLLFPVASGQLLVFGIFIFNVMAGYLSEASSKRAMVNLFGEYVAPELVTEMAKDPSSYSMEGDSRELTVMFSDVRGFTTISESLEPNELREYINRYLTTMSEIIRNNRGTLDKYIGDAIMAFWGAPIGDTDHASHALTAARQMQIAVAQLDQEFRARNWPKLAIGIGVNSGAMRVGDMGSKIRRAYTVMGDAVNLSSRLEGITKTYGVSLVVGVRSTELAPEFVYRQLDIVRVKGKNEPVPIFDPVALKSEISYEQQQTVDQWHAALESFRLQLWDDAEHQILALQAQTPDVYLYDLYLKRIDAFRQNPPGEQWDGVTTFDTK